ncbi:MAG: polyprenyl synthetase family protein [Chloroflexota bacterium]
MVKQLIEQALSAIDNFMENNVGSDIEILQAASTHIMRSGGKRIRPRMVLLAYLAAGGQHIHDVVGLAAAVELVHTASLVHDDINDHSQTRRGKPTIHAIWDRTFALLTGDYMFAKVYEVMAPYGNPYNLIMSQAAVRLVEGETLQAAAAKSGDMNRETYKQIISLKTASLFEAAARMGAQYANDDVDVVNGLAEYAYNLGMTFQIVDDILDIIGDPEALGKPIGTDLTQGRGFLAIQNGDGASKGDVAAVAEATAVAELDAMQSMMSRLRNSGAVEIAWMQAREMASRARAALRIVPQTSARDELEGLIDAVLNRDH